MHPLVSDPLDGLAFHLATCPSCQGRVLLLLALLAPPFPDAPCSCDECQDDLAAFIDLELGSPTLAAQTFPRVWWHLWGCPACAEDSAFVAALATAEARGELPPMPGFAPLV